MGQVTSLFARKVLSIVETAGDKSELLRSVGIDPDNPVGPAHMVPDGDYYAFLEKVAEIDKDVVSVPLRAGASMCCDDYGAFGLAWKSATNLRGSFERAERYARVLTSVSTYEVEPCEQGAYFHLHRSGQRRLGMRLSNEATLASVVSISRQICSREFRALAVYMKHQGPENTDKHEVNRPAFSGGFKV